MTRKILITINLGIAVLAAILLIFAAGSALFAPDDVVAVDFSKKERPLPKNAFEKSQEEYAKIGSHLFRLQFSPPTIQLPDLRKVLTFFGPNGRPDASKETSSVHFMLVQSKDEASVNPGERLYLQFDRSQKPARFVFSPNNRPAKVWIEADAEEKQAQVRVFLQDEEGKLISSPREYASFTLQQKEMPRFKRGGTWEIGQWRVDGTLLARQKMKWHGQDLFFQKHGGEEYKEVASKQRIDVGEGDELYSLFVDQDDIIVWDEKRWIAVKPGKDSLGKPLIQVKKITDRLMSFDLWDPEGKTKVTLNLLKMQERWAPDKIKDDIRCVAARTRSQYVFEIDGERTILNPFDWLVKTDEGWIKLTTEEEIDAYVDRQLVGSLFIFDGMVEKEEGQTLMGTLFNASRTKSDSFSFDDCQSPATIITLSKEQLERKLNPMMTIGQSPESP